MSLEMKLPLNFPLFLLLARFSYLYVTERIRTYWVPIEFCVGVDYCKKPKKKKKKKKKVEVEGDFENFATYILGNQHFVEKKIRIHLRGTTNVNYWIYTQGKRTDVTPSCIRIRTIISRRVYSLAFRMWPVKMQEVVVGPSFFLDGVICFPLFT